jgi:hypothetical protein
VRRQRGKADEIGKVAENEHSQAFQGKFRFAGDTPGMPSFSLRDTTIRRELALLFNY